MALGIRSAGYAVLDRTQTHMLMATALTESPIEQAFLYALCVISYGQFGSIDYSAADGSRFGDWCSLEWMSHLLIQPQAEVSGCRVDFLVTVHRLGDSASIAVECDGHEFHERTPRQASKDKARDRKLQAQGIRVFRFTGSDLWRDPIACASEVIELLSSEFFSFKKPKAAT